MSKKIKRGVISFLILFTFLLSVILALIAYSKNEWNTIASCLAVITALLATYISLRIVWKQEDDLEPDIIVYFDLESKTGIIQFVIQNVGGSNAYDLKLHWKNELIDGRGNKIALPYVPVLMKKESIRYLIDGSTNLFQKAKGKERNLYFNGIIKYKNSKKNKRYQCHHFEIGLPQFQYKIKPHTDEKNFFSKNSALSNDLKELNKTLQTLAKGANGNPNI